MSSFFVLYSNYIVLICAILCTAIYIGALYFKFGKEKALLEARRIAYQLFLIAQKKLKSDSGAMKMAYVISLFYVALPDYVKIFIVESDIPTFLQECYDKVEDVLDDGQLNSSNK